MAAVETDGWSAWHRCQAHGTPYVRLGLGNDGIAWDVSAAVRRSTRIASTALRTAVSSKTAEITRIHEPTSGHQSKIAYQFVTPNALLVNSGAPSKRATGKATSHASRRPRRTAL